MARIEQPELPAGWRFGWLGLGVYYRGLSPLAQNPTETTMAPEKKSPEEREEDLFQDSTMTFGEHLEELRTCLFKSLAGVALCFVVGLIFAGDVVDFIQSPVKEALTTFRIDRSKEKLDVIEEAGGVLPAPSDQLAELLADESMTFREVYVLPSQLSAEMSAGYRRAAKTHQERIERTKTTVDQLALVLLPPSERSKSVAKDAEATEEEVDEAVFTTIEILLKLLEAEDAEDGTSPAKLLEVSGASEVSEALAAGESLEPEHIERVKATREAAEAFLEQQRKTHRQLLAGLAVMQDALALPAPLPGESVRPDDLVRMVVFERTNVQLQSLKPHEGFSIYIKAALLLSLVLASPWVFYQVWMFVAAGLYPTEKRYVHIFMPFSLGLFLAGAAMAFFFVFQPVLKFLFMFNAWMGMKPDIRITDWLGFVLILPLGFGVSFQLPLVMLFLERIGVFTVEVYLSKWRIAILVISVLSMFLTPADPTSMLLMAVPLTVLYFLGIILCRYMPKQESPFSERLG